MSKGSRSHKRNRCLSLCFEIMDGGIIITQHKDLKFNDVEGKSEVFVERYEYIFRIFLIAILDCQRTAND